MDCNIISSQLSQNKNDSYTTAPYLFLESSDIEGFKKYLKQNSIGMVLIRKDYVKNEFTDFSHVDSLETENILNNESDFVRVYENKIFTIFSLKSVENNYGFSLSTSVVYANSELKTASDYKLMSTLIPIEATTVIYKNSDYNDYLDLVEKVVTFGNCVGCVLVEVPSEMRVIDESALAKLKIRIKSIISRKSDTLSPEEEVSISVLNAHEEFSSLLYLLSINNKDEILRSIKKYKQKLQNSIKLLGNYPFDFFTRNSKYIEIHNFLTSENGKLAEYLREQSMINDSTDPLNDEVLKTSLIDVFATQDLMLKNINESIWKTDFSKKKDKMRLDIPEDGSYKCNTMNNNSGVQIKTLSIDDGESTQVPLLASVDLQRGSPKVAVNYFFY